jgi:hypothetical protein
MARVQYADVVVNAKGVPQAGVTVGIVPVAGSSATSKLWQGETGAGELGSVVTNSVGLFSVWLDEGRYDIDPAGAMSKRVEVISQLTVVSEAGVNPVTYGAKIDGVSDDSAAWAAAIAVVAPSGGDIVMPPGKSIVATGLNLENLRNITIRGQGSAQGGSGIRTFRKDGGSLLNCRHTAGITFADMELNHAGPAGTAAVLLEATGEYANATSYLTCENCNISANEAAGSKVTLALLEYGISHLFRKCVIGGGGNGINGRNNATHSMNVLEIDGCTFFGQAGFPLQNLGQTVEVHNCVFEPDQLKQPKALYQNPGFVLYGLEFHANQVADAKATSGTSLGIMGYGIDIHSNMFFTQTEPGTKVAVELTGTTEGLRVANNWFEEYAKGIDKHEQTSAGVEIGPNVYKNVTEHHNFTPAGTLYVEA